MAGVKGMKRGTAMTSAERQHKYYEKNREKAIAASRKWRDEHREERRQYDHEKHQQFRKMVLSHYGNFCKCCGDTTQDFLTVDHINDDGAEHRRTDRGTAAIYRWLVKHDFPDGFQILCWNCNAAKQWRGGCPHQRFNVFTDLKVAT